MQKMQIDGIVIRYKSVLDLHKKTYRALEKVGAKKIKIGNEIKRLKRIEKALKRFLGGKQINTETVPYAIETVNS